MWLSVETKASVTVTSVDDDNTERGELFFFFSKEP